jgi:hypothetical protein
MHAFQSETSVPQRIGLLQLETKHQPSQNIWVSSGVTSSTFAAFAGKQSVAEETGGDRQFNFSDNINVKVVQQKSTPTDRI